MSAEPRGGSQRLQGRNAQQEVPLSPAPEGAPPWAHWSLTVRGGESLAVVSRSRHPSLTSPPDALLWAPHRQPFTLLREAGEPSHIPGSGPDTTAHIVVCGPGRICTQELKLTGWELPSGLPLGSGPNPPRLHGFRAVCVYVCIGLCQKV